jgi:uncharacterized membrane protein
MFLANALHLLAAVLWVGGMFFAYVVLRPSTEAILATEQRVRLWQETFRRFFIWVWLAVGVLLVTGFWMIFGYYGGMAGVGLYVHLMLGLGLLMMGLYLHLFFAPYKRLRRGLDSGDLAAAAKQLGQIRWLVAINLSLGVITLVIAGGGPYLAALR